MKRLAHPLVIAAALLWSAVLQAAVFSFSASLSGDAENPPNASPGTGSGFVIFDTVLQTLRVHMEFSGLTTPTVDSHIHCCADPTTNAGVAIGFTSTGFPLGVTSGLYDNVFDLTDTTIYTAAFLGAGGGTAAGAAARLLTNLLDGMAYLNIHTDQFRPGEIRGQLLVPEPGTMMLLGAAALLGVALRRRST